VNWPATLAAVTARGPRCEQCGGWTFRPGYRDAPSAVLRLCPDCRPLPAFLVHSQGQILALILGPRRNGR
jgi:hypothetical protein